MTNVILPIEARQPAQPERFKTFSKLAWRRRRTVVGILVAFQLGAVLLYIVTPPSYTATMTLAPPLGLEGKPSNGTDDLGALAEGLTGNPKSASTVQPYQMFEVMLTSRKVAGVLEQNNNVLGKLYPALWDTQNGRWRKPTGPLAWFKRVALRRDWQSPDSADLAGFIQQRLNIREVARTPIRQVTFTYSDPKFTAWFLQLLVRDTDQMVRDAILVQTEANLNFLRNQLSQSNATAEVRDSLASLTTAQLEMLVRLQNPAGFAVQIVDGPYIPRRPVGPNLIGMCVFAGLLGVIAAAIYILVSSANFGQIFRDIRSCE